jgi:adenosine deaminase
MESVRHQPGLLLAFLQQMPKGGDLHVHLSGAIYAESLIDWASESALCVDRSTSKLIHAACDSCEPYTAKPSVRCAYQDHILYDQLIDAWSMRNWHREEESGTTISLLRSRSSVRPWRSTWRCSGRSGCAGGGRSSAICRGDAYGRRRAGGDSGEGWKIGWDDDFGSCATNCSPAEWRMLWRPSAVQLDSDEARKKEVLHCGTAQAAPGCEVTIHYLYQVLRGLPREQVFAQILLGFEFSKAIRALSASTW